ncbi:DUF2911 domain-containing protein [Maribacter sp. HTCC2170]|uniref:DUF2911 domain-containing protein n=1 Tax=Maribacter sp. (strain HTCC2170 / KCCM 42371) TaxID=313603 RepID=UPI00130529AC|nr:DUF2911 domain-containing protein [Maribacter sp. HTCC2170]
MNKQKIFFKYILSFLILTFGTQILAAQQLMIPRASPKASLSQSIGVCSISVDYGRPSVRGRKIFNGMVPYGKVWRAGANEATAVSFNHNIVIGNSEIKAGKYGLFMIPNKETWTVILNKDWQQWGAYNYNSKDDIFRIEIEPIISPHTELCTYSFVNITKEEGVLRMEWEKVRVDIAIKTATNDHTLQEIDMVLNKVKENWYSFSAAAQYHFYELKDTDKALEYIDVAIALNAPNPSPWMLKSQIMASLERYPEAIELAEKAIRVCKDHNFLFEVHENEENIQLWKNK